ncbi:MAG: FtsX-like permease family protein [Bacteroidota bacterium]
MNVPNDISPPKWALYFLRWFCKPELLEYIEGDLIETFENNLEAFSLRKAQRKYTWEVLGLLKPGIIRNFHLTSIHPFSTAMLFNYLKVGLRQIRRHALFSGLNIIGLAVSMSVCLLVIMVLVDQFGYDKFHKNKDRIYRVISARGPEDRPIENLTRFNATSPLPIADELSNNYTGIESIVRMHRVYGTDLKIPDKILPSHGLYVDHNFLSVFDFGEIQGDLSESLREPFTLILSQSLSRRLYGDEDPMGKIIQLGSEGEDYIVTGVIEDPPIRSHIRFEFLASFSSLESLKLQNLQDRSYIWGYYVYMLLDRTPGVERKVSTALAEISAQFSELDPYYKYKFEPQALGDITPRDGRVTGNEIGPSLPFFLFYFLSALGFIIILSAGFNYTNLSLARSLKRAKEIGIRKVVGGKRRQLVTQFIIESVLVALIALLVGIILLEFLIPRFYHLDPHISKIIYLKRSPEIYLLFFGFSVLVGILAGLIPALHISNYRTIQVLKNLSQVKVFAYLGLRKGLIVFQFMLCLLLVTSTIFLQKQYKLLLHADHGFNVGDVLNVALKGNSYEIFSQTVQQLKEVKAISGSQLRLATGTANSLDVYLPDSPDSLSLHSNFVSPNFLENLELALVAGSGFPARPNTVGERYIVLNETAVEKLMLGSPEEAVGQAIEVKVSSDSTSFLTIGGVVEDFYDMDITNPIYPYAFRQGKANLQHANIRLHPGTTKTALSKLEKLWKEIDPYQPFTYAFHEDELADRYSPLQMGSKVVGLVSALAIVIALLGLMGMVTYMVEGHIKEVGIRKILGANERQLVWRLSKGFLLLLGIATLLSIPTSVFINRMWLETFALKVPISIEVFLWGIGGVIVLSLLMIISQTIGAAKGNPVEALKSE